MDDTGVYVVGYDSKPGSANSRWRIQKRDTSGDVIWTKTSNPSAGNDFAEDVAVDDTGVYVVGSYSFSTGWMIEKRRKNLL